MRVMTTILLARLQDHPAADSGYRMLTDRLWPRGVRKDDPRFDEWYKHACPSQDLRKSYHAKTIDFAEFSRRYQAELNTDDSVLTPLLQRAQAGSLVLVSANKTIDNSHLPVLRDALLKRLK